MIKQLLKYKWYIAVIFGLIIIEPSINSVLNFWLQKLFNAAVPGAERLYVLRLLTIGFLLWIFKRLVSFTTGVLKARYICNAKQDVKNNIFMNLLNINTSNISEIASSGEYISLLTNDITILEHRFFNQIISVISGVFSILILGTSFIALNLKLAVAILAIGIIAMLIPIAFSKSLNQKNLMYSNAISKFTQRMKEYLMAYPTIKNYSIEKIIIKKFDEINREAEDAKFEADYTLTLANSVGSLMSWFMQFAGVGMGLMLVIRGEILIGTVVAARSFASDLASPLQEIIVNINSIRSVRDIAKKLESLTVSQDIPEESIRGEFSTRNLKTHSHPAKRCDILFDDLCLTIENRTIIDHFSFCFESGKKYLVVGLNGSGKTSLFKALKKWFNNCTGSIFINGQNIFSMNNTEISKRVSYLNENVSMFSCSVRDNISLFREYAPEVFQDVVNNAQINLDLDRQILDEGHNISSGEQRRIEIARSLLVSVPVLIFDEVVSTLDVETAYEIEKMVLNFCDKTVIFISHNFSGKLIAKYDEILIMGNGRLLAHGTYDELLKTNERFRQICEIKFG